MNISVKGKNQPKRKSSTRPMKRRRSAMENVARTTGALAPRYPIIEKKNIDQTLIPTSSAGSWTAAQFLNPVPQGAEAGQRIGRRLTQKSLLVRWTINLASTNTYLAPFRILVVYDHSPQGALPAIADVLTQVSSTAPINAINNLDNSDRFIILHDELQPTGFNGGQGVATAASLQSGKFYVKFPGNGLESMWTGATSTGAITALQTGGIFLFFISQSLQTATLACVTRVRYTDA